MIGTGHFANHRRQQGFTLLEMMIALAIAAILTVIAIPMFRDSSLRNILTVQSNDLVAGALTARSEAIKRRAAVSLCSSTDNLTCTNTRWERGWIVRATDGTIVQVHKAAPTGFLINADSTNISFDASGLAASLANMTICRATPSAGSQERVLTINATGKSSIAKTTTGICTTP